MKKTRIIEKAKCWSPIDPDCINCVGVKGEKVKFHLLDTAYNTLYNDIYEDVKD